jgi:hypothetical protein
MDRMNSPVSFVLAASTLALLLVSFAGPGAARGFSPTANQHPVPATKLEGRWRVKFTLSGLEKNLKFEAKAKGTGLLSLLDTGPDNTPAAGSLPAAWSQLENDRVSFSGEAELPIGTCCREIGTVIFKGRFSSPNMISGKVVFVTSVDEEESPYKLKSAIGTFTATRDLN